MGMGGRQGSFQDVQVHGSFFRTGGVFGETKINQCDIKPSVVVVVVIVGFGSFRGRMIMPSFW